MLLVLVKLGEANMKFIFDYAFHSQAGLSVGIIGDLDPIAIWLTFTIGTLWLNIGIRRRRV